MNQAEHTKRGIVVSDFHLFSSRSDGFSRLESVYREVRNADLCILNGDIFDFGWTILPTLSETVERSVVWIKELLSAYPDCKFVYLLGNHDAHPSFYEKLLLVEEEYSNLKVEQYHFVLEEKVFLHGDTIHAQNRTTEAVAKYRSKFAFEKKQGAIAQFLFSLIIFFRIPNFVTWKQDRRKMCQTIKDYLDLHLKDSISSVSEVFFGHTHQPFRSYELDGISYTNTGSMIRKLDFLVGSFEYSDDLNI